MTDPGEFDNQVQAVPGFFDDDMRASAGAVTGERVFSQNVFGQIRKPIGVGIRLWPAPEWVVLITLGKPVLPKFVDHAGRRSVARPASWLRTDSPRTFLVPGVMGSAGLIDHDQRMPVSFNPRIP